MLTSRSLEIDAGIAKLRRRIHELENLNIQAAFLNSTGEIETARSNLRDSIREVFGPNSPEFDEHKYIDIWAGARYIGMDAHYIVACTSDGRRQVIGILNGLIDRLEEKKADLAGGVAPAPSSYFDRLNLHPRIRDVARDLFIDGHPRPAVFEVAKALINYVKERSGNHDLDGAPLVRTVFSPRNPVLAFNDLADQTDKDEQEGMMHLFEGAVQAIRNPGGVWNCLEI